MAIELDAKGTALILDRIGMTKARLGREIGVTTETIRSWERSGCKGPAVIALKAYASGWRP